jgi:site-specific DNA-methyltransferase (adenine-specific)
MLDRFLDNLLEGDCLDAMQRLPDKSIDMVLCDLPYGTTQNKWDSVIPLDRLWAEYGRVVKDDGVVALTGQGPFTAALIMSNPALFRYKIVWVKSKPTNFLNAKKQPLRKHEDICIFYKKQPTYNPQMSHGKPYNKGIRKDQFTGSYGSFAQSRSRARDSDIRQMSCTSRRRSPRGRCGTQLRNRWNWVGI